MDGLLLADSPVPTLDSAWAIVLVSRVLHVASGGVILGGLVYLKYLIAPLAVGSDDRDETLYRGRRSTWARLVMLCTTLLILSGFFNLYNIMVSNEDLPPAYHMLFGVKFLLAMLVFFVASGTAGASPMAVNMRSRINRWLNMALVATIAIFIIAATMRSFEKVPRTFDEAPAGDVATE